MNDTLRAPVVFGFTANLSSMLGIVTMSDNHGNQTRGRTLSCAGRAPVYMSFQDWADLHHSFVPQTALALNMNGEIPLGDMESPLQTMCRKLEAEKHLSPTDKDGSPAR
jgi:hypothetical protein